MRDTNAIGAMSEGHVLARLITLGYTVAIPFGVARYDLVLDMPDGLKRVQCKTGRLRDGAVRFMTVSRGMTGKTVRCRSYQGDADLFGVYCPENGKVYLVPVDNNRSVVSLRVDPPKNGQVVGLRMARDFEI